MSELFYEQTVNLRTNDFDTHDQIKPVALLELFQDVAGLHAFEMGMGYQASYDKGYYWILVRNQIDVFKNPIPLTYAKLKSWPHEKGRIDFNREYLLEDMDGNVIARGISKWVIIDINTRRLLRASNVSYGEGSIYGNNYYEDVAKVAMPDGVTPEKVLSHKVSKNDIDHNEHMNNARYADLVFDTLPDMFINNLLIEYVHEVKLGEMLDIYLYEDAEAIYHMGMTGDTKVFVSKIKKA